MAVTGTVEQPAPTLVRPDDPLLAGLDLSGVAIPTAQRLEAPTAESLVAAEGTPLLVRGAAGDLPFVYLGFPWPTRTCPCRSPSPSWSTGS